MQMPIVCPGCFPCSLPLEKIRYVYRKKQIFHNVRQFITRFFQKKIINFKELIKILTILRFTSYKVLKKLSKYI